MITGRRTALGLWIVYFTDERVDDLDSRIYSRDIGHHGRFSLKVLNYLFGLQLNKKIVEGIDFAGN